VVAPRMLRSQRFLWAAGAAAAATRVALNMSRGGPHELVGPLTGQEGRHEYLPTVGRFVAGPLGYLRHFSELVATALPIHAAGHPPGATIILAAMHEAWL